MFNIEAAFLALPMTRRAAPRTQKRNALQQILKPITSPFTANEINLKLIRFLEKMIKTIRLFIHFFISMREI